MSDPQTSDELTSVAELRAIVERFVAERDWRKFHTPKNLSMALAIEAAELMEHFQWLSNEDATAVVGQPAELAAVGEELADVVCYACAMANALGLDISTLVRDKMLKNAVKYPADQCQGKYKL